MNNVIKSEFKKLWWLKSSRLLWLLVVGIATFFSVSISFTNSYEFSGQDTIVLGFVNSVAVLILYIIIFAAIFISLEFSSNTIRNYISSGVKRRDIYIGKFVVFSTGSIVLVLLHTLIVISIITLLKGWGNKFSIEEFLNSFVQIIVYLLIYLVISSVILVLSILVRSISGAMACNIGYLALISMVQVFFNQDNKLSIVGLLSMGQLMQVQGIVTMEQAIFIITCCIIKIVLLNIFGMQIFDKCEV